MSNIDLDDLIPCEICNLPVEFNYYIDHLNNCFYNRSRINVNNTVNQPATNNFRQRFTDINTFLNNLLGYNTGTYSTNTQTNTQTNTRANTQTNTRANTQANTRANTQANTRANTQTNTQANIQANTQANTQANIQANTQENAQTNIQENAQTNTSILNSFYRNPFNYNISNANYINTIPIDNNTNTNVLYNQRTIRRTINHPNQAPITQIQRYINGIPISNTSNNLLPNQLNLPNTNQETNNSFLNYPNTNQNNLDQYFDGIFNDILNNPIGVFFTTLDILNNNNVDDLDNLEDVRVYIENINSVSETITYNEIIDKDKDCAICLENFTNLYNNNNSIVFRKTLCNHIYCDECLSTWLSMSKKCPLCSINLEDMANGTLENDNEENFDEDNNDHSSINSYSNSDDYNSIENNINNYSNNIDETIEEELDNNYISSDEDSNITSDNESEIMSDNDSENSIINRTSDNESDIESEIIN